MSSSQLAGTTASPRQKPIVLVVEDDRRAYNALSLLLTHYEYEIRLAPTVREALEILLAEKPDIVLLDLMLPDGNGITVMREIRSKNVSSRVFVTTGVSDPEVLAMARGLEPEAIIRKPVDFLSLLSQIRSPMPEPSIPDSPSFPA
jgi:DNA-binding response OmpR family regulator